MVAQNMGLPHGATYFIGLKNIGMAKEENGGKKETCSYLEFFFFFFFSYTNKLE